MDKRRKTRVAQRGDKRKAPSRKVAEPEAIAEESEEQSVDQSEEQSVEQPEEQSAEQPLEETSEGNFFEEYVLTPVKQMLKTLPGGDEN